MSKQSDVIEPVVTELKPKRRTKYGSMQEVWNGEKAVTRSGLKKEDLVELPSKKIVSKKQHENIKLSTERLKRSARGTKPEDMP